MAGTKRERKLRRIERRGQRLAEKVMSALGRMGETGDEDPRKQTSCEKLNILKDMGPGDHGHVGICIHCEYRIPHGEGCKMFPFRLEFPPSPIPDAQWRKFKNWEFDRWKQRTRKQKRSCRP